MNIPSAAVDRSVEFTFKVEPIWEKAEMYVMRLESIWGFHHLGQKNQSRSV